MPFLLLTQRRLRQPHVASFRFLTAGTHRGNCAGRASRACTEVVFVPLRGGIGTMVWTGRKKPARNPTFAATNRGFRSCPAATLKKGRSQCPIRTRIPASRTRTPDRSRVNSRAAGRNPDSSSRIRTARVKSPASKASRTRIGNSATPRGWSNIVDELKERSRQGGAFLFGMLAQPGISLRGHLDLSWNLN